ncbi:MAG TPA: hypothetical protein VH765_13950 [Xanthobacteraceae bacterium]|jgi:hypothetical protein
MTEHTVVVWGKPHLVIVERRSKSVWNAVGHCLGESITAQGRSEGRAINRWREVATSRDPVAG